MRGVVFVGVGIFPHRVAGDKNFLLDLSTHLRSQGLHTRFVSIVNGTDLPQVDGYTFVNRMLHSPSERYLRRDENGRIIGYWHAHGTARTLVELTSTLVARRRAIKSALRPYDRAVIHWMDSSLMIPALRAVCGERHRYVTSIHRYMPSSRPASGARAAALRWTHRVFAGTEAARARLIEDGCPSNRVVVRPWGCAVRSHERQESRTSASPARILWAGFLQQIGREDLLRSLALAQRVRQSRTDIHFTFSLKPECYSDELKAFAAPGIDIGPGGKSFLGQLPSFDAFLSPVSAIDSTPAPPLTWLEAMAAGVPIITTKHPGVDEVVVDGRSGIVAADYDALESALLAPDLIARLHAMREGARNAHSTRYEIKSVAAGYAEVYDQLLSEQR